MAADPLQPAGFFLEQECAENGEVVSVATILLTNRECPWRCLMCDLWQHTLEDTVPTGAIPAQMDFALARLAGGSSRETPREFSKTGNETMEPSIPGLAKSPGKSGTAFLKLYNAGSFFDPRAIPAEDYAAIASRANGFERVIVESHPALIGERVLQFQELLRRSPQAPRLEVAMGLETVHPEILPRLNKRMTLDQFARATDFLRSHDIAVRAFVLVKPPFLAAAEALLWANRSVDFAFNSGASVASLIPVRAGNGALDALAARGDFSPPRLATLEAALAYSLQLRRGRVFADIWDLAQFSTCPACFPARAARLRRMNLRQQILPRIVCPACEGEAEVEAKRRGAQFGLTSPLPPPALSSSLRTAPFFSANFHVAAKQVPMSASYLIKDMPVHDRPRERLLLHGAEQSSDAELIAILLRVGSKGISAVQVAQELLKKFSTLGALARASIDELRQIKGVGRDKAIALKAAFTLAQRMARDLQGEAPLLDTPERIASFLREFNREATVERFQVVLLNTRRRLIRVDKLSQGTQDTLLVHPREVFRSAILANAAAIVLAHNHPSGDPTPSEADIKVTRDLIRAGQLLKIDVLDHVILGQATQERPKDFLSLRELGYFYA